MDNEQESAIKQAQEEWAQTTLKRVLDRTPEQQEEFTTSSLAVKGLYTPANAKDDYLSEVGFPGQYPFTRGIQPNM